VAGYCGFDKLGRPGFSGRPIPLESVEIDGQQAGFGRSNHQWPFEYVAFDWRLGID
jgi:hypothetical protein